MIEDDIFCAAIELASQQDRDAYLTQACGGDPALRDSVQKLLDAHFRAGEFLESPAPGLRTIAATTAFAPRMRIEAGTTIGPYRIIRQLGEGGIGAVYLAEQLRPVRRQVALKIIKLGMDSQEIVTRFEAERQALAMMDHPNVAKVFDAGTTEQGRPYFVMEVVEGTPITQFCDHHRLGIAPRLELFIQVCQAIQHAHQKGLIHRDIKPSNVLVSEHDGQPVAKVIDFGIAKATQSRLTERTLHTAHRQLIGTPQYMSPEQADGSLDIDTRTDVYSLGVLLYELLTGTTPFATSELRSKPYSEIERVIREVDPVKPSTRVSQIADARGGEARRLSAAIRGELDWIVMKCLEKDRSRRYDSAAALAADVKHHLSDEPVTAAAPSRSYRLRKFVRRHRVGVIAAAAVFAALIAGTVGTTIGLIGQARQRADAERLAGIAMAVSQFQADMLRSASPLRSGQDVTVVQVIQSALDELDAGKLKHQPIVEANVRHMIGRTFREMGRYSEAEKVFRKTLELRRLGHSEIDSGVANALSQLGTLMQELGRLDEAEKMLREAVAINRQLPASDNPDVAGSLGDLGYLLQQSGKYAEAESLCREAVQMRRQASPVDQVKLADSLGKLGWTLQFEDKFAEAEAACREAVQILRRELPPGRAEISGALNELAVTLARSERLSEAEPLFREVLEIDRKRFPATHPTIGQDLNNLAASLQEQGKYAEAEPLQREGLEIRRKSLPAGHPYIAQSLRNVSVVLHRQGKLAEAEPFAREALAIRRKALPAGHQEIVSSLRNLGSLLRDRANYAEAEPLLLEAEQIVGGTPNIGKQRHDNCVGELVELYSAWDKAEPGKGYAAKAEQWRQTLPASRPSMAPTTR